jgi:hypothetical protein
LVLLDSLVSDVIQGSKIVEESLSDKSSFLFEGLLNFLEELISKWGGEFLMSSLVPGEETVLEVMETPVFALRFITEIKELVPHCFLLLNKSRIAIFLGVL